jgi:antitoxin (DNA-binding transcriptional repressor) of toxin-antitoxin stability system
MAILHLTEAELARDIGSVLDRVKSGAEIIIEHDKAPFAVLRPVEPKRRKLSEIAAALSVRSTAILDKDFARDVEDFITRHREALPPSNWD